LGIAPGDVLADLRNRYAEPQRRYHTWAHIEALLGWFALRRDHLHDPVAVELAILFHDAVYDPRDPTTRPRARAFLKTPISRT